MKFYFLFLAAIFYSSCEAQSQVKSSREKIVNDFVKHFNESNYTEAYFLFNSNIKNRNSIHKLEEKLRKLRKAVGRIVDTEFIEIKENIFLYKVRLEKGTIALSLHFDDNDFLSSVSMGPFNSLRKVRFKRNSTSFILPFKDEWYVFWGGNTVFQNYHNTYPNMFGAFDFWIMGPNGKSFKTDGKTNEDYYAFGKEIIAPCDGVVVMVIDDVKDNVWPSMNRDQGGGNIVILKTKKNEYLQFAHLKKNSIVVKENQYVKQGQKIGLCGNSGLSTEPHLHFQLQDSKDLISTKGTRSFFEKIYVDGKIQKDYSPKRGDKVSNLPLNGLKVLR